MIEWAVVEAAAVAAVEAVARPKTHVGAAKAYTCSVAVGHSSLSTGTDVQTRAFAPLCNGIGDIAAPWRVSGEQGEHGNEAPHPR